RTSTITKSPGPRKIRSDQRKSGDAQIRNHAHPQRDRRRGYDGVSFRQARGVQVHGRTIDERIPHRPARDRRQEERPHLLDRQRATAFKRVLKAMPAGGRVGLRGPAGMFTLDPDDARPAVYLAGGIGVTPFVSMLRDAAHSRLGRDLWLFYSNRRPEDAAFLEELAALPKRHSRCHFVGTMVEMAKSGRPWNGETGFLDRAMLERHLKDLAACVYYAAGPPGLVEAMRKMLADARVEDEAIRTDEFFGY